MADTTAKVSGLKALVARMGGRGLLEKLVPAAHKGKTDGADDNAEARECLAILEGAFLMAAADGNLEDAEIERLAELLRDLTDGRAKPGDFETVLASFAEALDTQGFQVRVSAAAQAIRDPETRRAAFMIACGLAYVDEDVSDEEEDTFGALAEALEIPENEAQALLDDVEKAVAAPTD